MYPKLHEIDYQHTWTSFVTLLFSLSLSTTLYWTLFISYQKVNALNKDVEVMEY